MKTLILKLTCISACALLASCVTARAEEKKTDPTGTWKSSFTNQNDQVRETVVKLKLDGDKLTGTVSGRNNDTEIKNAKLSGDEISFEVTREFGGNSFTIKYSGKISGDTITGKTESERDGQTRTRDWIAKREAAEAKTPATK